MSTGTAPRIELRITETGVCERRIVASTPAARATMLELYEAIEPFVELIDRRLRGRRHANDPTVGAR